MHWLRVSLSEIFAPFSSLNLTEAFTVCPSYLNVLCVHFVHNGSIVVGHVPSKSRFACKLWRFCNDIPSSTFEKECGSTFYTLRFKSKVATECCRCSTSLALSWNGASLWGWFLTCFRTNVFRNKVQFQNSMLLELYVRGRALSIFLLHCSFVLPH